MSHIQNKAKYFAYNIWCIVH